MSEQKHGQPVRRDPPERIDPIDYPVAFDLLADVSDARKPKSFGFHMEESDRLDRKIAEDTGEVPAITSEVAQEIGIGALSGTGVYGPPAPGEAGSPIQPSQAETGEAPALPDPEAAPPQG